MQFSSVLLYCRFVNYTLRGLELIITCVNSMKVMVFTQILFIEITGGNVCLISFNDVIKANMRIVTIQIVRFQG